MSTMGIQQWTVAVLLASVAALAGEKQKVPKVFVHVDPRVAQTNDAQKRRDLVDSVTDIREHLQKRRDVEFAKDRFDADILVTILDRRLEVNRSGATSYFGYTQTHYQSRYILAYRLEARGTDFETETALAGAFVTWKRVAGVLAKDIEQWARDHREDMLGETSSP
jgi:hypothetical protein